MSLVSRVLRRTGPWLAAAALALGASPAQAADWRASAATFVPRSTSNTWIYSVGGCIYRTGPTPGASGSSSFDIDLQLPDGAEIEQLTLFFYDNDATRDAEASIIAYPGFGLSTTLTTVTSSGTPGQLFVLGPTISHVVDNEVESLAVRLDFNGATTSALRICAVHIVYDEPAPGASGPTAYHYSSASTYGPSHSETAWVPHSGGCRAGAGGLSGSRSFRSDLHLPDGAIVEQLRVDYYDMETAGQASAMLLRHTSGLTTVVASTAGSGGTPGYSSDVVEDFSHVVNNFSESLELQLVLDLVSADLRVCGARVGYQLPPLFADGFESGTTLAWSATVP